MFQLMLQYLVIRQELFSIGNNNDDIMLSDWTFDHIGMAVSDIEATAKMYIAVGYSQTKQVYDPIQNVYICFLYKAGMPTVELLMPHDNTSPVQRTLDERGGGYDALSYMLHG